MAVIGSGDFEREVYYLPDRQQKFVVGTPGTPYRLKVTLGQPGDYECLVFNGAASYADVDALLGSGASGVVCSGVGTHYIDEMVVGRDSRAPLVFEESGVLVVKLFNRKTYGWSSDPFPAPLGDEFERGYEIGQVIVHYGLTYPT